MVKYMNGGTNKLGSTTKSSKTIKHSIKISFCLGCIFCHHWFRLVLHYKRSHRFIAQSPCWAHGHLSMDLRDSWTVAECVALWKAEGWIPVQRIWWATVWHRLTWAGAFRREHHTPVHFCTGLSIYVFLCFHIALTASNLSLVRFGLPTLAPKFQNII